MQKSKSFKLQLCGSDKKTVRVSIPRQLVASEALSHALPIADFVDQYRVQWLNNTKGGSVLVNFIQVGSKKKEVDAVRN